MSEPTVTINLQDVPITSQQQQLSGILIGTKSHLSTISDTPVTDPGSSSKVKILKKFLLSFQGNKFVINKKYLNKTR